MVSAVTPRWHGDNYQSRIFWQSALCLLDGASCVVEVTFEADGPRSFDDVVVKYQPPMPSAGPTSVSADYHQVKWHVEVGGRFGFANLVDPNFIGATSISLLQRLRDAKKTAPPGSRFSFITTYRTSDGDPIGELISGNDHSLLVEKLFDGTTDRSRLGTVRKLWREHLELKTDDELREIVTGLRIVEGYRSLDELRREISLRAKVVGLLAYEGTSDFRYDELARQLKSRQLNTLTRAAMEEFCKREGLWVGAPAVSEHLPIAVRSFDSVAADVSGATPENTLVLTGDFRQRYLRDDQDWQRDIRPNVEAFLRERVRKSDKLRLILDAHASIAFLSGTVFDVKSAVGIELVQKGRVGARTWRADDGTANSPGRFSITESVVGEGSDFAVVLNVAQMADAHVRAYVGKFLPQVARIMSFTPSDGPGQQAIAGGGHAAKLAEQVAQEVRARKVDNPDAVVHVFAAAPNSLLFFLGQLHQAFAPSVVYEFDYDRRGNKTYQPSFVIE